VLQYVTVVRAAAAIAVAAAAVRALVVLVSPASDLASHVKNQGHRAAAAQQQQQDQLGQRCEPSCVAIL
jgi:hypothetical protein